MTRKANIQALLALAARGANPWVQHAVHPWWGSALARTLSTQSRPDVDAKMKAMAKSFGGASSAGSKIFRGEAPRQRRAAPSNSMENLSRDFFLHTNALLEHQDSSDLKQNVLECVKTLVYYMHLALGQPHTGTIRVATSDATKATMPADYIADERLFKEAIEQIGRLQIPYNLLKTLPHKLAQQRGEAAAAQLDSLLFGMEATPGIRTTTRDYNTLMGALRYAGNHAAMESLYARMLDGRKGADAMPDVQTAKELFWAFSNPSKPDVKGMMRLTQQVISCQHLRTEHSMFWPGLVSLLLATTARAALRQGDWGVVSTLLQIYSQARASQAAAQPAAAQQAAAHPAAAQQGPAMLGRAVLVEIMAEAAEADKLSLAMEAWQYCQEVHKTPQVEEGALVAVLQAAARAEDAQEGGKVARQMFGVLERTLKALQAQQARARGSSEGEETDPSLYRPSPAAYQAHIHALSRAHDWEASFHLVADMEGVHGAQHPACMSPLHGLAPLAEALARTPGAVGAAYQVLLSRQLHEKPVTSCQMDVVLRAMALGGGGVDATGQLFEEYPVAGLKHTADSYHAVMEACVLAAQPIKATSVMSYMQSQGLSPSSDTYDLLLRSHLAAGDLQGARTALVEVRKVKGLRARLGTIKAARDLAATQTDWAAESEFSAELEFLRQPVTVQSGRARPAQ